MCRQMAAVYDHSVEGQFQRWQVIGIGFSLCFSLSLLSLHHLPWASTQRLPSLYRNHYSHYRPAVGVTVERGILDVIVWLCGLPMYLQIGV